MKLIRNCKTITSNSRSWRNIQIDRSTNRFLKLSFILPAIIITSLVLLALTGFVCTHKIQAEEECLSSNVLCYECDSRFDPNCADPFDFSPTATLESPLPIPPPPTATSTIEPKLINANESMIGTSNDIHTDRVIIKPIQQVDMLLKGTTIAVNTSNETIPPLPHRQPKKLPAVAVCHGCCVKITSRMVDGGIYVKRTCTTNLQINYFMVGLVCMKESGDRGKMCFCETDYCNGQISNVFQLPPILMLLLSSYIILSDIYSTITTTTSI